MKYEIRSIPDDKAVVARSAHKVCHRASVCAEDLGLKLQKPCSARDDNRRSLARGRPSQSNSYVGVGVAAFAVFAVVMFGSVGCDGHFDVWESVGAVGLTFFLVSSRLFLVAAVSRRPVGIWIATALIALVLTIIAFCMEPGMMS